MEEIQSREWMDGKLGKDLIEEICKYFVPDFREWENGDAYQEPFDRLVRDLKKDMTA